MRRTLWSDWVTTTSPCVPATAMPAGPSTPPSTASSSPPLLRQLKPGGKLVIPVGEHHGYQELLLVEVDDQGEVSKRSVLPVRFVPLTRD